MFREQQRETAIHRALFGNLLRASMASTNHPRFVA